MYLLCLYTYIYRILYVNTYIYVHTYKHQDRRLTYNSYPDSFLLFAADGLTVISVWGYYKEKQQPFILRATR